MKTVVIVLCFVCSIICGISIYLRNRNLRRQNYALSTKPYLVSEYYEKMEKVSLDLLESRGHPLNPVILWWGLDGITTDKYGFIKWISRAKSQKNFNQFAGCTFSNMVQGSLTSYPISMLSLTQAPLSTQMQNLQLQSCQAFIHNRKQDEMQGGGPCLYADNEVFYQER